MRRSLGLALAAWCCVASAQELGTLFHTPKERELLERLRRGEKIEATAIIRPDPTVTGFVKRSDGKSTVFLDKQPFSTDDPRDNKLIEPGIVERFEPLPLPPPPPPQARQQPGEGKNARPEPARNGVESRNRPVTSTPRAKGTEE